MFPIGYAGGGGATVNNLAGPMQYKINNNGGL